MIPIGLLVVIVTLMSWWLVHLYWHRRSWRIFWATLAVLLTVIDIAWIVFMIRMATVVD
ncbi:hypothetical protein ACFP3T_13045 [Lactiplantibacillus dongliensis]|uniref:Integral membrane protein n=1 Tax=Lactiplantibacillus dongliensis TaxID=2559919 RepID=A0ABW1R7Y4_9LACO|nr:hypothetical protein [Lactiplantibacillus dongliensis]